MNQKFTLADAAPHKGANRFIQIRVKRALNLGTSTMLTSIDIGTFLSQSMIGNDPLKGEITQRKLDSAHAQKMAIFIFKGLLDYAIGQCKVDGKPIPEEVEKIFKALGTQPYYAWSPVVVTIRDRVEDIEIEPVGANGLEEFELKLRFNQLFWVIDGQHRREAWERVLNFLNQVIKDRKYTKSGGLVATELTSVSDDAIDFWRRCMVYYRERFSISLDIHTGLTIEQERQLFHDLNNLQKTVAPALAQQFDLGNPINIFSHRLIKEGLFGEAKISEERKVDWDDQDWMRLDSLNAINARLFLNATTISSATPAKVGPREDDAFTFWETVTKIPGIFDRNQSVAAQPALLKSIARVYFELKWSRFAQETEVEKFLTALPKIDFSHRNLLWDITHMTEDQLLSFPVLLEKYLPQNWREKEVAEMRLGTIRFGNRHNESILVLPGIVRFLTGLPPSPLVQSPAVK